MGLDANQVLQDVHDPTNNALRVLNIITVAEAEPADGDLENTEGRFWKDGADHLNFKHKDSGGTVRTIDLGLMA